MFDTIILITHVHISSADLKKAESITFQKDGVDRTKYKYKDSILKITYRDYNQLLEIECSIPKFLFGNNVDLIKESDIPLFFQRLHKRLHELFHITIRTEDWYTKRLDVCWNFPVHDDIDDYLKQLAEIKLPRMWPETYGFRETVVHRNNSRRISFYNKQKECRRKKQPTEIIQHAQGLLRMEVNAKEKSLSKYSAKRKAIDLLSVHFFDYTMRPILSQVKLPDKIEGISYQWIKSQTFRIDQIDTVLGFRVLQSALTPDEIKQLYSDTTLSRRMKLSTHISFPGWKSLAPLSIDFDKLG